MGIRDFVESKMTPTHFGMSVMLIVVTADIINRKGPVLGTYHMDVVLIGVMVIFVWLNKKQDHQHHELKAGFTENMAYQNRMLQLGLARLESGMNDVTGEALIVPHTKEVVESNGDERESEPTKGGFGTDWSDSEDH